MNCGHRVCALRARLVSGARTTRARGGHHWCARRDKKNGAARALGLLQNLQNPTGNHLRDASANGRWMYSNKLGGTPDGHPDLARREVSRVEHVQSRQTPF